MTAKVDAELDKVISYQVTGQSEFRDEYLNLLVEQRRDYDTLRRLGPQLGEDVHRDLAILIYPSKPVSGNYIDALVSYVNGGGKVLIVDTNFCVVTSFKWLSFKADPRRKHRRETAHLNTPSGAGAGSSGLGSRR